MKQWGIIGIGCLACIALLSNRVGGWGTPSSKNSSMANTAVAMAGVDYSGAADGRDPTLLGGHTSPSTRRTHYNTGQYTSAETYGVDCSGLVLVCNAVAGGEWPDATAHTICTNTNYTQPISGSDYRRGDVFGHNEGGTVTHCGIVTTVDPANHRVKIHRSSGPGGIDQVGETDWIDTDTNTYWNTRRRDP